MIDSSVLPPVMPAHAGIHDLPSLQQRKSWIPAFAGMTGVAARASMFRAGGINRMDHLGGCHCDNIHVRLRLSRRPEDSALRACTCSFCRSHSPPWFPILKDYSRCWLMIGLW